MVGKITQQGITIRQGDSFSLKLYFKDENGVRNIEGSNILMQVRDQNNQLIFTKTANMSNAEQGEACIALEPQDTDIEIGEYYTDIQITDKYGEVHTVYPQNINNVAYFKITRQISDKGDLG